MNPLFKVNALMTTLLIGTAAGQDIPAISHLLKTTSWKGVTCETEGDVTLDQCYQYTKNTKATIEDWETQAVRSSIVELSPHWAALNNAYWNLYQLQNRQFMVRLRATPQQRFDVMWDSHPLFKDHMGKLQNATSLLTQPKIPGSMQFFFRPPHPSVYLEDHPEAEQALLVDHLSGHDRLYFRTSGNEVQIRHLHQPLGETLQVSRDLAEAPIHRLNNPLFYGNGENWDTLAWVDQNRKVYSKNLSESTTGDGAVAGQVLDVEHLGTLPEAGIWPEAPKKAVTLPRGLAFELQNRIYVLWQGSEKATAMEDLQHPKILTSVRPSSDEVDRPVFVLVGEGEVNVHRVSVWKCLRACQKQDTFPLPFPARVLPVKGTVVLQEHNSSKALRLFLQQDGGVVAQYLAPLNTTGNLHNLGGSLIYPTEHHRLRAVNFLGEHFEEEYFDFVFGRRLLSEAQPQPIYVNDTSVVLQVQGVGHQLMGFGRDSNPLALMEAYHSISKFYPVFESLCRKGTLNMKVCFDARNMIGIYEVRNQLDVALRAFERKDLTETQLAAEFTRIHNNYLFVLW